jgi:hypothetical protein
MKRNKRITKREDVARLLESPGASLRDDYSALMQAKVYELPDKRILIVRPDGKGALWDPAGFQEVIASLSYTGPVKSHFLEGLLPSGEKFPTTVPDSANLLSEKFRLPIEDLSYTMDSLLAIDRRMSRFLDPQDCVKAPLFEPLTAYFGEVLRRAVDGEWVMRRDDRDVVWEPWIVTREGREFAPFLMVFEEFNDAPPDPSLRGLVLRALA